MLREFCVDLLPYPVDSFKAFLKRLITLWFGTFSSNTGPRRCMYIGKRIISLCFYYSQASLGHSSAFADMTSFGFVFLCLCVCVVDKKSHLRRERALCVCMFTLLH